MLSPAPAMAQAQETGVDNRVTVLGREITAQTLRKVVIWFGVIGVLLCSIVGSGVLSLQEGARPLGTRQPPASTRQVAIVPAHTPTPVGVATTTPTFVATWTPSPTVTGASTPAAMPTAAATSPVVATSTAAAPATATPTNAPISAPTVVLLPPTPVCLIPAGWQSYSVRPGDTLTGLAWRTGATVAAIMQANCLRSTTIYAGQRLYLPAPPALPTPPPTRCVPNPPLGWVAYVVQAGDTLFGLAIRHGTSLAYIQQVNCLPGTVLFAGQHLYLPYIPPTATMQIPATPTLVPTWTATTTPAL
jgi:LysM repeat protein